MFKFLRRLKSVASTDTSQEVTAQPTTLPIEELLKQLSWQVIRRLDGQLQGDYRTLFRGSGLELADLREYKPHDDVRHIDWNVTARMQTAYVRQHLEDREMTAYFLIDLSGSMGLGSEVTTKRNLAFSCLAVLARILTRRGNPVGAMLFSGKQSAADSVFPARTGKSHVLQMIQAIQKCETPKISQMTDLRQMLLQAQAYCKKRSTIFVMSDFIASAGWERTLGSLAYRHEVIAIRFQDPWEVHLPALGLLTVEDSETGEHILIDTNDKGFRDLYQQLALERDHELQKIFERSQIDCLTLKTNTDLDQALLNFMLMRKNTRWLKLYR